MTENSSLFNFHDWRFLSIRQYGHVSEHSPRPNPLSRHSKLSPLKLTILIEAYDSSFRNFTPAQKVQIFAVNQRYQGLPTDCGTKQ